MTSRPVITDAEAAAIDVPGLLAGGLADEGGRLRGELQGLGAVAAAVQLELAGVESEDVALALTELRNEAMGVEVVPAELPAELARMVQAGRAAGDRELLVEWLGLVANLLRIRSAQ